FAYSIVNRERELGSFESFMRRSMRMRTTTTAF
ncbi:hypothetical protein PSYMO_32835, partial [Pseudomonas amygdali pv. mori str. 301020]